MRTVGSLVAPRRQFLRGLASLAVCAPAVVHASSLMRTSVKVCDSALTTPLWTAAQDPLALLQHEMERRFAETVFGAENLSTETENAVLTRNPVVAEAKMTALWELRTSFGPRGSPPKPLEDLPAEVRAGLSSMFGSNQDRSPGTEAAGFSGFAAHESGLRSI